MLKLTGRTVAAPASSRFQIDKPGLMWHQSQLAMGHLLSMWLNVTSPYAVKSAVDSKYRQVFLSNYIPREMCYFSPLGLYCIELVCVLVDFSSRSWEGGARPL